MNRSIIIQKVEKFVQKKLSSDTTGHDWWHINRVRNLALIIARKEKANIFIVELGALLHDIADWKYNNGDLTVGAKVSEKFLKNLKVDFQIIEAVKHIVQEVSFKGAGVKSAMKSLEGKIVQDADRIDAIGAIGIARVFAYGGAKNRPMHDPTQKFVLNKTFDQYKKGSVSSIAHFYEKLLLVKDRMNTKTGKRMAVARHKFMQKYLKSFYKEWEGK